MYTAIIFHPEDLVNEDYISDVIEGHEEYLEVRELASIGWSDSDDENNDEAVNMIVTLLHEVTGKTLGCAHPQSFEPSELVDYKSFKVLVTAGPNVFASVPAIEQLAKDAGVNLERYEK